MSDHKLIFIHIDDEDLKLSLLEVNAKLKNGELSGNEPAWTAGLDNWIHLKKIKGVKLPEPPPYKQIEFGDTSTEEDIKKFTPPPINDSISDYFEEKDKRKNPVGINETDTYVKEGIGGWLLFLCISLVILSPIATFSLMSSSWNQLENEHIFDVFPSIQTAAIIENTYATIIVFWGMLAGIRLWAVSPDAKNFAINYLKYRFLGYIVAEIIVLMILANNLPNELIVHFISSAFGAAFRELVFFLIWFFYLKKSRRVKKKWTLETGQWLKWIS